MAPIHSATLMCHAPIVIPQVAGAETGRILNTTVAMKTAAAHIVNQRPNTLIVISPHTPRLEDAFGIVGGDQLAGDFAQFGHPEISIQLPADEALGAHIVDIGGGAPRVKSLSRAKLDHGCLVPLYFMREAGWEGLSLVVALPMLPSHDSCQQMGRRIAQAVERVGRRAAILASGDMSHALKPGAPAGFHPSARAFDDFVVQKIKAGDLRGALEVDDALRDAAAEDVIDSLEVAAAAANFDTRGHQFLSYEGPFGVGYLVAIVRDTLGEENA